MKLSEQMVLMALRQGPATNVVIQEATTLKIATIRQRVHEAHKRGEIHIQGWERSDKNQWLAIWASGAGSDAAHPVPPKPRAPAKPRTRHPTVESLMQVIDTSNPFAVAMFNVGQMGNGR